MRIFPQGRRPCMPLDGTPFPNTSRLARHAPPAREKKSKKRSERRKHCTLAVVRRIEKVCPAAALHRCKDSALAVIGGAKNFRPAADPLAGGARRPKFNQLEMITTFTYRPVPKITKNSYCTLLWRARGRAPGQGVGSEAP